MKTHIKLLMLIISIPGITYSQAKPTSYDSDGDGIPDSVDQCPYTKGTVEFNGCPYPIKITANDRDGDGIKDADDACPDIFGLKENKGCPDMFPKNFSNNSNSDTSLGASQYSLYTTTTSSTGVEKINFKNKLLAIIADSKNMFVNVKLKQDTSTWGMAGTGNCLPGALECSINTGQTISFAADFGTFDDQFAAGEKYNELKNLVSIGLGESEWVQTEICKNGYIEKCEFRKKTADKAYSPVVIIYARRIGNNFNIFLTVEEQNNPETAGNSSAAKL